MISLYIKGAHNSYDSKIMPTVGQKLSRKISKHSLTVNINEKVVSTHQHTRTVSNQNCH